MFPSSTGMFERYQELKNSDPYKGVREEFAKNYNRQSWVRKSAFDPSGKTSDPNFGMFKSKIDAAENIFIGVLTERRMNVRIIPKYAKPHEQKSISDKVSAAFHDYFVKPWEDRFDIETLCVRDMIMCGKGIEHWPTLGCFKTENIPCENVFPDTSAGLNPKTWSYVFIEKNMTICELIAKMEDQEESTGREGYNPDDDEFNQKYLKDILKEPDKYADLSNGSESEKNKSGDHTSSRDKTITVVYAYIKDYNNRQKPVSKYVFLGKNKEPSATHSPLTENPKEEMRFLFSESGYCKCISQCVHVRRYQVERNYWKFNSFAKQIFFSTMLYDKSMSLVLRAAKRSMILYWKSADRNTQQKLMRQTDAEIQVVDESTNYITTGQAVNVMPLVEAVRQVMIDTENGQSIAQAPGSQNVKGYAITAEEASIRNQRQGEQEALNLKVLMTNDVPLYKELFDRAMRNDSQEYKKAHKAFVRDMKELGVDPEYYDPENVYFASSYLTGGTQGSRLMNAQGVFSALLQQPSTPGQEQAQRDLIGAFVGYENVDDYISTKFPVDPVVLKVGGENEDLDNPFANPTNIPVLPTDKHMVEIPIHVADYEKKLQTAQQFVQMAQQAGNPFLKIHWLVTAQDLIAAQDNKGGHITGHLSSVSNNPENLKSLQPILDKFKQLQGLQDQMTQAVVKMIQEFEEQMKTTDMQTAELRFKEGMHEIELAHAKNMSDVGLAKAVDQKKMADERAASKLEQDTQKKGLELAHQEEKAKLDIDKQTIQNEQSKAKSKTAPNKETNQAEAGGVGV